MAVYLIDANIFLEVELGQAHADHCERFLRKVERGELNAVIPDFAVDAIALVMEAHGKTWKEIRTFLISLSLYRGLAFYHVTHTDKIRATDHMRQFRLDFDDSVVLQSALSGGAQAIVSLDADFDRAALVRRLEPKDA